MRDSVGEFTMMCDMCDSFVSGCDYVTPVCVTVCVMRLNVGMQVILLLLVHSEIVGDLVVANGNNTMAACGSLHVGHNCTVHLLAV